MEGFNYIGMGNSTNKKDAQSNAARDFVNYLVRVNEIKREEIPALGVSYFLSLHIIQEAGDIFIGNHLVMQSTV